MVHLSFVLACLIPSQVVGAAPAAQGGAQQKAPANARDANEAKRAEMRAMLAETRSTDTYRLTQIAQLAAKQGFLEEALSACDLALASKGDRERIEEILAPLAEKEFAEVTGARRSTHTQELLNAVGRKPTPAREMFTSHAFQSLEQQEFNTEIGRALVSPTPAVRRFAVELWGSRAPVNKLDSLFQRTMCDTNSDVRDAASKALATRATPEMTQKFVRSLGEKSPSLRIHSAEALGNLGKPEAMLPLIKHLNMLQQAGTSYAPRAFFSSCVEQAYVADYNVEVAQASAIAEPVVSTLQSGVVLDVRVLGAEFERVVTLEKNATREALAKIAGVDMGADPKAWAKWLKERQEKAAQKIDTASEPPAAAEAKKP
jgi:hypothetical protein